MLIDLRSLGVSLCVRNESLDWKQDQTRWAVSVSAGKIPRVVLAYEDREAISYDMYDDLIWIGI